MTKSYWPFMPLEVDAFMADWEGLTHLQQAIYDRLFFVMWRAAGKRLPADDDKLARFARVTRHQWQNNKGTVLEKFTVDDQWISHPLIHDMDEKVEQKRNKNRLNSLAKSLKRNNPPPAVGLPTYNHNHNKRDSSAGFARSLALNGEHREAHKVPDAGHFVDDSTALASLKDLRAEIEARAQPPPLSPAEPQSGNRDGAGINVSVELSNRFARTDTG